MDSKRFAQRLSALALPLWLAGAAFAVAQTSPLQAPNAKPDLRFECEGQAQGKISFTIWSAQSICARNAGGKTSVLRCTVSSSTVDIPSAIGAERIDRASGKFSGIFGATNRPSPYGGKCQELKP